MFVLDDLLIRLPARGIVNILKRIIDMAEAEYYDENKIRQELQLNQTALDTGQINEDDYFTREDALLQRLAQAMSSQQTTIIDSQ